MWWKNKNKKSHRGRTIQTRDEHFAGQAGKNVKPDHPDPNDMYRTALIIRDNDNREYAVVPLTTKKGVPLSSHPNKKSKAKDFIEIYDRNGEPIKLGKYFKPGSRTVSESDVQAVENYCLNKSKRKQRNQKQLDKFNSRPKKK
ncbi:MAG: hypothetical protein FWC80_00885 [Firmicutes bacterium]|nr:hypothetical protein [Bacillota bacterium]